jgi:formate dehydrogenase subunit delta
MDVQRLVAMANDIARYFVSEPERDAGIQGIADHLRKFWTPRMCEQLAAHVDIDDSGLDPCKFDAWHRARPDLHAHGST